MNAKKTTVYVIGECMLEFSRTAGDEFRRSFAGDVYNTSVYLKRLAPPDCTVEFITAVGDDPASFAMVNAWRDEGISTNNVATLPGKSPGLYAIDTDEFGERQFSYWRSCSAARELAVSLRRFDCDNLEKGDLLYYSGITLAILSKDDREVLFEFVEQAKKRGVKAAFDPNYRAVLWENRETAAETTMKAYGLADIVLTGVEEEASLFGWSSEASELSELTRIGVKEAILKAGERGIFGMLGDDRFHVPFTPAANVVDTTAAGDSFAGAYLAFRLRQMSPETSAAYAAHIARIVIASPGAIVERDVFFTQLRESTALAELF